jgi:hypothetical protein
MSKRYLRFIKHIQEKGKGPRKNAQDVKRMISGKVINA